VRISSYAISKVGSLFLVAQILEGKNSKYFRIAASAQEPCNRRWWRSIEKTRELIIRATADTRKAIARSLGQRDQ
jgi:hypothetical protein